MSLGCYCGLSETDAHAKAAALEQDIDRLSFTFEGHTIATGASAGVAILGPHSEAGRALAEPTARCMCERRSGATKPDTNVSKRPAYPSSQRSRIMTKPEPLSFALLTPISPI